MDIRDTLGAIKELLESQGYVAGDMYEGVCNALEGAEMIDAVRTDKAGFVTHEEIARIAANPMSRLTQLLVRCGNGRFLAPAQDVLHFIAVIQGSQTDYVRDVSFPVQHGAAVRR